MRAFQIPIQIQEEERAIGGALSFRQLGYILLALVIGIGLAISLPVPIFLKFVILITICAICLFLSFARIHGLQADKFCFYYLKYYLTERLFY